VFVALVALRGEIDLVTGIATSVLQGVQKRLNSRGCCRVFGLADARRFLSNP
jgi:hypothetical protein